MIAGISVRESRDQSAVADSLAGLIEQSSIRSLAEDG